MKLNKILLHLALSLICVQNSYSMDLKPGEFAKEQKTPQQNTEEQKTPQQNTAVKKLKQDQNIIKELITDLNTNLQQKNEQIKQIEQNKLPQIITVDNNQSFDVKNISYPRAMKLAMHAYESNLPLTEKQKSLFEQNITERSIPQQLSQAIQSYLTNEIVMGFIYSLNCKFCEDTKSNMLKSTYKPTILFMGGMQISNFLIKTTDSDLIKQLGVYVLITLNDINNREKLTIDEKKSKLNNMLHEMSIIISDYHHNSINENAPYAELDKQQNQHILKQKQINKIFSKLQLTATQLILSDIFCIFYQTPVVEWTCDIQGKTYNTRIYYQNNTLQINDDDIQELIKQILNEDSQNEQMRLLSGLNNQEIFFQQDIQ